MSEQGFSFDSEIYEYVYQVVSIDRYAVNTDFPKIIRIEMPPAIVQAQYDI
jgi:spore coat polysaccharide biosynthesis predicted glycosyltransferase SpsG